MIQLSCSGKEKNVNVTLWAGGGGMARKIKIQIFDGFFFLWTPTAEEKGRIDELNFTTRMLSKMKKKDQIKARDAPLFAIARCDAFFVPCSGPMVWEHKKALQRPFVKQRGKKNVEAKKAFWNPSRHQFFSASHTRSPLRYPSIASLFPPLDVMTFSLARAKNCSVCGSNEVANHSRVDGLF